MNSRAWSCIDVHAASTSMDSIGVGNILLVYIGDMSKVHIFEQMKAFGNWTPFSGDGEMVDPCCPRIESKQWSPSIRKIISWQQKFSDRSLEVKVPPFRKFDIQTDGHEGSSVIYTSNNVKLNVIEDIGKHFTEKEILYVFQKIILPH